VRNVPTASSCCIFVKPGRGIKSSGRVRQDNFLTRSYLFRVYRAFPARAHSSADRALIADRRPRSGRSVRQQSGRDPMGPDDRRRIGNVSAQVECENALIAAARDRHARCGASDNWPRRGNGVPIEPGFQGQPRDACVGNVSPTGDFCFVCFMPARDATNRLRVGLSCVRRQARPRRHDCASAAPSIRRPLGMGWAEPGVLLDGCLRQASPSDPHTATRRLYDFGFRQRRVQSFARRGCTEEWNVAREPNNHHPDCR
jgi:hypothetical protein